MPVIKVTQLQKQRLKEKLEEIEKKRIQSKSKEQIDNQNPNKGNRGGSLRNYDFLRGVVEQNGKQITTKDFLKGKNLEDLK